MHVWFYKKLPNYSSTVAVLFLIPGNVTDSVPLHPCQHLVLKYLKALLIAVRIILQFPSG